MDIYMSKYEYIHLGTKELIVSDIKLVSIFLKSSFWENTGL